jgi:Tfp pilus assembly protein PilO
MQVNNHLKQRDRIILVNIITLALLGLIYIFAITPSLATISEVDQKTSTELANLHELERRLPPKSDNKSSIKEVRDQVEQLSKYFISDDLAFVTGIENLAAKNNVSTQLTLGTAEITGKYKKIALTIRSSGSYLDQLKFMSDLENMRYFFNIQSTELTPNGPNTVGLVLVADTYWNNNDK